MPATTSPTRPSAAPFKQSGAFNRSRGRLFSISAFMSDPFPTATPFPRRSSVKPFATTTLPSSSPNPSSPPFPNLYFQPLPLTPPPPPPPRSHPPHYLPTHSGLTSLRTRTSPSHTPAAPSSTLSLSHQRELRWVAEPHRDAPLMEAVYRGRGRGAVGVWRGVKKAGWLFGEGKGGREGDGEVGKVKRMRKQVREVGGVRHVEAWRGGGCVRVGSDRGQMAGKAEAYLVSPFHWTEAVQVRFVEQGVRSGHRYCEHTHVPLKLGAKVQVSGERRFHSRRSVNGLCHHQCNGVEENASRTVCE